MSALSSRRRSPLLPAVGAAVLIAGAVAAGPASALVAAPAQHVLVLSIDGMHQSDLAYYAAQHPTSALAALVAGGKEFTGAETPFPSDSTPGIVGQMTGGDPGVTGIYYDDTYNHYLLPPGTTKCTGATLGTEVAYQEAIDRDPLALDAGQGLPNLPDGILAMTPNPLNVIDPAKLPVDPATCQPILPHQYLRVNTVFEVARAAGLRTAWSDKHPAAEALNGPSGTGVQDFFTPEINSNSPVPGLDWTGQNSLTRQYDSYKVQAVINEINGFDHTGTTKLGTPAIFGMNFQTVSTAQKLPISDGKTGGYLADGVTPGPLLSDALDYINAKVGAMVAAINADGLAPTTAIILSAKHGQSPQTPSALTRIPDGPIIAAMNAAWKAFRPGAGNLVAFSVDDDGMIMWLNDRGPLASWFARDFLLDHAGIGNDINGNPKPYTASGLTRVYTGTAAARLFGVRQSPLCGVLPAVAGHCDDRVPDLVGIAQYGTVFTGKKAKIAEHGGANPQDRNVPLVVSGAPVGAPAVIGGEVETTQVAPTILSLLGLDPHSLQAVQIEGTRSLLR
ncbi:MAG TPA: alkaline phosphatase family protein [Solirubrobacteraceae bacterium]|nr:alkaline phosphatase family protein [Solirubrobacteraceae bacterium]